MTAAIIVSAVLIGIVGPLLSLGFIASRRRLLAQVVRHRIVVSLRTGETFTGVLVDHDLDGFLVADAEAIGAGERGTNAPVDGRLLVLREDVAYIQLI